MKYVKIDAAGWLKLFSPPIPEEEPVKITHIMLLEEPNQSAADDITSTACKSG
ncbi:MAG: hypothetical protein R2795_26600 [Saprospiraceae bacterium]